MNHTSWLYEHFLNHGTWANKERQNLILISRHGFHSTEILEKLLVPGLFGLLCEICMICLNLIP